MRLIVAPEVETSEVVVSDEVVLAAEKDKAVSAADVATNNQDIDFTELRWNGEEPNLKQKVWFACENIFSVFLDTPLFAIIPKKESGRKGHRQNLVIPSRFTPQVNWMMAQYFSHPLFETRWNLFLVRSGCSQTLNKL